MYYYIVDPQKLSQREFERVQNLLYSSLSEYRVSGEVVRVTGLRTINQLVENAFVRGVKTLVAVGSEDTLHDLINAIGGRDIVVGFIPLFESEIGNILGIKNIEQACKTIGVRRIAELDLGVVNQNFFVSKLSFGLLQRTNNGFFSIFSYRLIRSFINLPTIDIKFSADNQYQGSLKVIGGMIINSRNNNSADEKISDPTDGILDVLLVSKLTRWATIKHRKQILEGNYEKVPGSSLIHVKKIEILNPPGLPLRIGSRIIAKTPATIEIIPKTLKIIVGKDRKF